MILFIQNIMRLVLLIIVQVFVLNHIHFLGFVNPYIYILAFLMWPVRMNRALSLLLAMAVGLLIDAFNNTPGIHASASVLLVFLRVPVLHIFANIEEGSNPVPSFKSIGVANFIKYVSVLALLHHSALFLWEAFGLINPGILLFRILLNSFITILILLGIVSLSKE